MDLEFNKEQQMFRKSVAEFLGKECTFDHVKELEDSEEGYSSKIWKKMAKLGWMELYFPEEYGGLEDSFLNLVIIMEEMGKKAFPSPFFSSIIQCGLMLMEGGTDKQKKDLLPKLAAGKCLIALAQCEEDASYNDTGINMSAQLTGDSCVLSGIKMFVLDANIADYLIVAAKEADAGITLFLVDTKTSGITCKKMKTIGKDNNCVVEFNDVKVPKENTIGKPGEGWKILEITAQKAVVAKCAEMMGGCAQSIEMTVTYAKQREQYGTVIGGYQIIQHYMADMKTAYDTCLYYLYKTAWMIDMNMDTTQQSSTLKAQINENYKFITEKAIQIHGGIGTTREFDIGLFYRRAKASEYVLGDTDFHHNKIAQSLELCN